MDDIDEEFIRKSLQLAISRDKLAAAAARGFKEGLPYKLAGQLFAGKEYLCALCGQVVEGFRDRDSAKEFRITGTCQKCQDEIFKEEP